MTRDATLAFFAHRQQAWKDRDPEVLAEGYTDDCTVVSPMFATLRGRESVLTSYRSLVQVFPDWDFRGDPPLVDGDRVALPFSVRATHSGEFMGLAASGRRFEVEGVLLFRMENGLIAHEQRIYDFTGLLIQLGILRSKPAKP